jgi:mitochondrial fission protein ELM1
MAADARPASLQGELSFLRHVWILSEGIPGMENQCLGLAQALGVTPTVKRIALRRPWLWLPPQFFPFPFWGLHPRADRLAPPWPDLLIACGRKSAPFVRAVKRLSIGKTFTVQTQDPKIAAKSFDLVIPPAHDLLSGPNVFPILGAPHRITRAQLESAATSFAPRFAPLGKPLVGVLVGGPNHAYQMTAIDIARLCENLMRLVREDGVALAVTTSRRTPAWVATQITRALTGKRFELFSGEGNNPYLGILALADAIVVTADSVNMATEAAYTGKPLFVAGLTGGSAKFDRFHTALALRGIARPLEGRLAIWHYEPLDETKRAAEEIRRRLLRRHHRRLVKQSN